MSGVVEIPSRPATAAAIAGRDVRALLYGFGIYVAVSVALVAAIWVLLVDVRALRAGGILVLANPFGPPIFVALLVLSIYLAVSAAVSVARDRESGVLEVLFYAPVDEASYIAGKLLALLLAYGALLILVAISFAALAALTGFSLTAAALLGLIVSIIPVAAIVAFGILLAIGTSRVRTAVMLLVGVVAILIGVSLLYGVVRLLPIDDPSSPILPIRDTLAALDLATRRISPFAWLERTVEAALSGSWRSAGIGLASALAGTLAMLALAAFWLRRRGVLQGEA